MACKPPAASSPAPNNIGTPPLVVGFVSLGCAKNLVDSERMLASLALEGFVVTGELSAADVAVVNTCAFIDQSRAESAEVIDEIIRQKRAGDLQMVVVAGCWPQLDKDEILDNWPDLDAVVGLDSRGEVGELIRSMTSSGSDLPVERVGPFDAAVFDDRERLRLTPRHYAFLRITEGCDNRCSYCTIPLIRGRLRSKPLPEIVAEAEELIADGTQELIIIGQDTTSYGADLGGSLSVADVLRQIDVLQGVRWLRLLYTHPASFADDLVRAYGELQHLLPYVDLPLQHIADPILKSMGRRTTRREVEDLIARLRAERPDMVLRTSLIVGYPGETDEHFAELMDFVRQVRFDRLGAFTYSTERGTRAAALPDQVPDAVKVERLDELMAMQQCISRQRHEQLVGRQVEVIIDQGTADPATAAVGRLWSQAPDVDGVTLVASAAPLCAGDIVQAVVDTAGPYDLEAHAVAR